MTSQAPTLRWVLPDGIGAARVEFCRDRACQKIITTFDAQGGSGAPAEALAPGVVFWRLRSLKDGAKGKATSPVWQFTVGHRSAPVDTSWGATLDVNGDGFADVAVGSNADGQTSGKAYVFLGSEAGVQASTSLVLSGIEASDQLGVRVASAGDVNGDGFADLLVGAAEAGGGAGKAYVFLGGSSGLPQAPSFTLEGKPASRFGAVLAGVGDVNGDGYGDIVVGAPQGSQVGGKAFVYLGGPTGLTYGHSLFLTATDAYSTPGVAVAAAGDVNGDGFADVLVGPPPPSWDSASVHVYLYLGGSKGPPYKPSLALYSPGKTYLPGPTVACAGDINGDGLADIVVGAPYGDSVSSKASVYLGSAAAMSASPSFTLKPQGSGGEFGDYVAGAGDVNGDGFADVLVGEPKSSGWMGGAHLYLGGPTGLPPWPNLLLDDGGQPGFLRQAAGLGDVNGDGLDDVVIGAPASQAPGAALVYLGGATSPLSKAPTVLTGGEGEGGFGRSVASADRFLMESLFPSRPPRRRHPWARRASAAAMTARTGTPCSWAALAQASNSGLLVGGP